MKLPAPVQASLAELDPKMQQAFRKDFKRRGRSLSTAYVMWILLGWHYLYMGRTGMQFAFWFTIGGLFIWWIVDFFRLPWLIARRNEDIARELMTQYRMMVRRSPPPALPR